MNTGNLSRSLAAKRIGQFVRNRRRNLGLSRAQLARRLGFVLGSVVSHVERGDARIAPQAMGDWARALEMDPAEFAKEIASLDGESASEASPLLAAPAWA